MQTGISGVLYLYNGVGFWYVFDVPELSLLQFFCKVGYIDDK